MKPFHRNHLTQHNNIKYTAGPVNLLLILGMRELCCYGYAYYTPTVWVFVCLKAWQTDKDGLNMSNLTKHLQTIPNMDSQPWHTKETSVLVFVCWRMFDWCAFGLRRQVSPTKNLDLHWQALLALQGLFSATRRFRQSLILLNGSNQ